MNTLLHLKEKKIMLESENTKKTYGSKPFDLCIFIFYKRQNLLFKDVFICILVAIKK